MRFYVEAGGKILLRLHYRSSLAFIKTSYCRFQHMAVFTNAPVMQFRRPKTFMSATPYHLPLYGPGGGYMRTRQEKSGRQLANECRPRRPPRTFSRLGASLYPGYHLLEKITQSSVNVCFLAPSFIIILHVSPATPFSLIRVSSAGIM